MVDVDFILETVAAVFLALYYLLEGMVKAVLPAKYQFKKDLAGQLALVTGAGKPASHPIAAHCVVLLLLVSIDRYRQWHGQTSIHQTCQDGLQARPLGYQ